MVQYILWCMDTYLVEDNMYGSFKCLYLQIVSLSCTLQWTSINVVPLYVCVRWSVLIIYILVCPHVLWFLSQLCFLICVCFTMTCLVNSSDNKIAKEFNKGRHRMYTMIPLCFCLYVITKSLYDRSMNQLNTISNWIHF